MKKFVLGTAIKISVVLDTNTTPDSVKITIEDSAGVDKVTSADMSADQIGRVYSYIWQTTDGTVYDNGTYEAIISVVSGDYTTVDYQTMQLIDITN